ncbi:MAG: transposase [Proteobacteria bacterium]|nr:transposase [Pseudomonadota bacterium]
MPSLITVTDPAAGTLEQVSEAIGEHGFDPRDQNSLNHAALWLRRLGNNRTFLGDVLVERLAARHRDDAQTSGYGPQVIMLVPPSGQFFIRANLWPAENDYAIRASGGGPFAYGMAHDHNFDFLTLGYFGPGYWSDYYEYDYEQVVGWQGEPVPSLRFIERSRLEEGKILHYRAHLDVHAQFPADSLSVSLNVMHMAAVQGWLDQYRFDLEMRRVGTIISPAPSEALLKVAIGLGSDEAIDLGHRFAHRHPSDRLRLAAWDALAAREADPAMKDALWREAEESGSLLVEMEAKVRRKELAMLQAG